MNFLKYQRQHVVNVSHCIIEFFGTVLKRNWLKRDHLFYELDIKTTTLVYVMMKRPPKICIGAGNRCA